MCDNNARVGILKYHFLRSKYDTKRVAAGGGGCTPAQRGNYGVIATHIFICPKRQATSNTRAHRTCLFHRYTRTAVEVRD